MNADSNQEVGSQDSSFMLCLPLTRLIPLDLPCIPGRVLDVMGLFSCHWEGPGLL